MQVLVSNFLWIGVLSAVVILGKHLDLGGGGGDAWLIISEEMVTRFDAFNQARSMLPEAISDSKVSLERSESKEDAITYFIYTAPGDNMLTPEGLRIMKKVFLYPPDAFWMYSISLATDMKYFPTATLLALLLLRWGIDCLTLPSAQVEETFLKHETYQDLCLLSYDEEGNNNGCKPPRSLLSPGVLFLNASSWDGNKTQYMNLDYITQEQIDKRLQEIVLSQSLSFLFGFHFDANFGKRCDEVQDIAPDLKCTGFWLKSKYVRSLIEPVGVPILNMMDEKEEGVMIDKHMKVLDEAMFEVLGMSAGFLKTALSKTGKVENFEIVFMSGQLSSRDFGLTVNMDLMWAAASFLAVFTYMAIHTKSLLVSSIGMFSVVASFVLSIFAVKIVFRVRLLMGPIGGRKIALLHHVLFAPTA
jgi:hypothetical protein